MPLRKSFSVIVLFFIFFTVDMMIYLNIGLFIISKDIHSLSLYKHWWSSNKRSCSCGHVARYDVGFFFSWSWIEQYAL